MTIVVEDGTSVSGANSYVTTDELRTYADLRGLSYPSDDVDIEILLIKAADYLESFRDRYKGDKSASTNALQWPRTDVYIDGYSITKTTIPTELKNAQIQIALDAQAVEISPNELVSDKGDRKKEKVDVIEVEYFERSNSRTQPKFTKAMYFLSPLLKQNGLFAVRA